MVMPSHQVHDQGEECERRRQKRVRVKELDGKVKPCVPQKKLSDSKKEQVKSEVSLDAMFFNFNFLLPLSVKGVVHFSVCDRQHHD